MEVDATQPEAVADATDPNIQGGAADNQQAPDPLDGMYPDDRMDETGDEPVEGDETPEQQTEGDEADTTPIDAPVSWDKEAKEKFSKLPPDMQSFLAQQDAQRNRQVQEVTTRAKEAQQSAAAEAAQQVAESQNYFAQQLEMVAQQFLPPEPTPDRYPDWGTFAQAKQAYDHQIAQHQGLMQQAHGLRQQAQQHIQAREQQELMADAKRVMVDLPEMADNARFQQLVSDLTPIAKELGYTEDRIAQAWPSDIAAMKKVKSYKEKAEKWDALQQRKMEGVRSAKTLPKVTQPGSGRSGQQPSDDPVALLYPNG